MKLPNKLYSYKESTLSKLPAILARLEIEPLTVLELYNTIGKEFDDISDYIECLDCLYILERIDIDEESGKLYYVKIY